MENQLKIIVVCNVLLLAILISGCVQHQPTNDVPLLVQTDVNLKHPEIVNSKINVQDKQDVGSLQYFVGAELIRISLEASQVVFIFDKGEVVAEAGVTVHSSDSDSMIGNLSPDSIMNLRLQDLIAKKVSKIKFKDTSLLMEFSSVSVRFIIHNDGYESVSVFFLHESKSSLFF